MSRQAADALVRVLQTNVIGAATFPARPALHANAVRIRVGLKPIEYFSKKKFEEIKARNQPHEP